MSSQGKKTLGCCYRGLQCNCLIMLAYLLSMFSNSALALSCEIKYPEDIVKSYPHILVVVITHAQFIPNSAKDPYRGSVVTQFDTVEVIQGDPAQTKSIVIPIQYLDDSWPALVPMGYPVLVTFPESGIARWDSCEHELAVNWCNPYMLRKLAGHAVVSDPKCEWSLLKLKFKKRGIETVSEPLDLEGLKREWYQQFGEWPE